MIMSPDARDDPVDHVLLLHPPHHIGHLQLVVQPLLHLHARGRPTFYTSFPSWKIILKHNIRFICQGFFVLDYAQIF
jgi:hypothetical protein